MDQGYRGRYNPTVQVHPLSRSQSYIFVTTVMSTLVPGNQVVTCFGGSFYSIPFPSQLILGALIRFIGILRNAHACDIVNILFNSRIGQNNVQKNLHNVRGILCLFHLDYVFTQLCLDNSWLIIAYTSKLLTFKFTCQKYRCSMLYRTWSRKG